MAKKLQMTEVQKINMLSKGLMLKWKPFGVKKRGAGAKRPRYDRKKED